MNEVESCKNCRWVGCKHYGHDTQICLNYIAELKPTHDEITKMVERE